MRWEVWNKDKEGGDFIRARFYWLEDARLFCKKNYIGYLYILDNETGEVINP